MSQELAEGAYHVDPANPTAGAALWIEGATLARTGPGTVAITLDRPTNFEHFTGTATLAGVPVGPVTTATFPTIFIENTNECIKTVRTFGSDGTLVDASFFFIFQRKG
jgi:hypothetical protein